MSVLQNTRPGSFKGVPFKTKRSTVKRGVSRTNYLLANTKRRISKAMGGYAPDFSLNIFTHSTDGDEYERRRDALIAALDDDAPGTLVHPFLGDFYVVAGVYEISENFDALGVCYFTVPFFVVDKNGDNPLVNPALNSNPSDIRTKALAANRAMQSASADAFGASSPLNKIEAANSMGGMMSSVTGAFAGIGDSISNVSDYVGTGLDFVEQAQYYADNPLIAFATVADSILGVDGLTTDVYSKFVACRALFNYATATLYPSPSTPVTYEQAERKTNNDVCDNFIKSAALFEAYSQSANLELATVNEINETIEILNDQFEALKGIMNTDAESLGNVQPDYEDSYNLMNDLRIASLKYFEQQRITAARVLVIDVMAQPASVLAYTLYGDSTRAQEIIDLNDLNDNMVVSGQTMVLSK